jgi:hypothetical protein
MRGRLVGQRHACGPEHSWLHHATLTHTQDLQPGSFLSRLRHMRGEAGEPARTVHLGSHLGPLAPEEEHALEVAVGGPEQQEQGGDKRKADKRTAGSKHRSEVPDALRYADNHVTTAK